MLNGKGLTAYSISFLVGIINDLGFRKIMLESDNDLSTKSFQDAVIQACAGVQVIPHGPHYMANGRVEMTVREVKRQRRTLWISAEQNTSVRIADDSTLLSWHLRFATQVMNKRRFGKGGETTELRRTGRRWRKPVAQYGEKVSFRKIGELCHFFATHDSRNLCWSPWSNRSSFVHYQGWGCTRQKLDEREGLCGTPWQMARIEVD